MDDLKAVPIFRPVVLLVDLGAELGGKMHLADGRRAVAVGLQYLGEGQLLVPQGDAVVAGAVVFGVAPGQDGAAGRRADRVLDKVVVEGGAVEGQAVDVGGVDLGIAVAAQCVVTQLIRHDQQDVGAPFQRAGVKSVAHSYHHLIRSVTSSRSLLNSMSVTSRGRGRSFAISFLIVVGLLVSTRIFSDR